MKIKRFLSVCLAAVIAVSCCACSLEPKTPAQAAEKMNAALLKTPCCHAQLVMDIAMTLDAGESGTIEVTTTTTNDIKLSQKPVSGYTTATVNVDYGGEKSQTITENYSVAEDGELVSYIHSNGVWIKASAGRSPEDFAKSAAAVSIDEASVAIDETVTEYDGKEAVCLTTRISGKALQASLGGMLESLSQQIGASDAAETTDTIDYSALTCDARIYLDKKTYLPMAEEMTFSGMSEVLNPMYEKMGLKADVTGCTASAVFLSYESQEVPTLPDGAQEKAETWMRLLSGEPDNGDGTFTIREGTTLIDIAAPEGFEVSDKGYDHVYFKRADNREVRYTAYHSTAEQLVAQIDRQLERYSNLPQKISRERMKLTGDVLNFEADIIGVNWSSYEESLMYGWADLSSYGNANYFIFIEVTDGYNDGLGNSKSADVTPEEFMDYLNGATPSALMDD